MIRRKPSNRGKKTSKRRKSRLALRRECDKRFAIAIKQRDNWQCVMCGANHHVQCAHIVSRRYHATRWLFGNAVTLCARHHMMYTHDPLGWDAWVEARIGLAGYNELKILARAGTPWIDYEAVLKSLPEVGE